MRLGIVGSRTFPALIVERYVDQLAPDTVVITGGWMAYKGYPCVEATPGVDRIAWRAAEKKGLVTVLCTGSSTLMENKAGLQRNPTIVNLSEYIVAFWDLKSRGTMDTLRHCQAQQRSVLCINPEGSQVQDWARYVMP